MSQDRDKLVVFTRKVPGGVIDALSRNYRVRAGNVGVTPRGKLLRLVRGAHAIVSVVTDRIDGEIMDRAGEQLALVAQYAVGFDNVDVDAAKKRGVYVTNTPSKLGDAVAEFALSLILAVSRKLVVADDFMRAGRYSGWDPCAFLGQDLTGKTLGVVGVGRIGSVVAERAKHAFEMKLLYTQRHKNRDFEKRTKARYVQLPTLLRESDVVVMAVPLSDETYHMIGKEEFLQMKSNAIFINISRGKVVSEKALVWALHHNVIWGAGLDVFENEFHIGIDWWHRRQLLQEENVILTPHIASATIDAREEMAEMVEDAVTAALSGRKPPYLVY